MNNQKLKNTILYVEVVGFVFILLINWGLELFDLLPYFTDGQPTPVNWPEACVETATILAMAAIVIGWTRHALTRIRQLEGLVHVCSYCKKVEVNGRWISIEEYILDKTETFFSHGICKDCMAEHYPDLVDSGSNPRAEK